MQNKTTRRTSSVVASQSHYNVSSINNSLKRVVKNIFLIQCGISPRMSNTKIELLALEDERQDFWIAAFNLRQERFRVARATKQRLIGVSLKKVTVPKRAIISRNMRPARAIQACMRLIIAPRSRRDRHARR